MRYIIFCILWIFSIRELISQDQFIKKDSFFKVSIVDEISNLKKTKSELEVNINKLRMELGLKNTKTKSNKNEVSSLLLKSKAQSQKLNGTIDSFTVQIDTLKSKINKDSITSQYMSKLNTELNTKKIKLEHIYNLRYEDVKSLDKQGQKITAIEYIDALRIEMKMLKDLFDVIKVKFTLEELDTYYIEIKQQYMTDIKNKILSSISYATPSSNEDFKTFYTNRINSHNIACQIVRDENLKNHHVFNTSDDIKFKTELDVIIATSSKLITVYQLLLGQKEKLTCSNISESTNYISAVDNENYKAEAKDLCEALNPFYDNLILSNSMKIVGKQLGDIQNRMVKFPIFYKNMKTFDLNCSNLSTCIK